MITLNRDIEYTHSVLSYLLAGYHGKFTNLNILAQLAPVPPSEEEVNATQEEINQINKWFALLWENKPIFSLEWEKAESEDAKAVFSVAHKLGDELANLSLELDQILQQKDFNEIARPKHATLIAAYGRHAYARDNYLRCFSDLYKNVDNKEQIKLYKELLKVSDRNIKFCNEVISAFQKMSSPSLDFYHALFAEVISLPGLFRTQIHDMRLLWSVYDGPFSFELAKIPSDRSALWQQLGLSPIEAGYWESYGMLPEEVQVWMANGITLYEIAGLWKSWRFPPEEALKWMREEFSPGDAVPWANEGFNPKEARQLINRGVAHPSLIK